MKTKFLYFPAFVLLFYANLALSQTTFSVSDTVQDIYKNTTFGTIHGYVQLTNLTSADLNLRWKLTITGKYPSNWIFSCADPDTNYTAVQSGDSADFTLDLVSTTTNKLIYGLDHQATPGSAQMHFLIFDPNNPSEKVTVHFNLYILDATGIHSLSSQKYISIKNNTLTIINPENIEKIQLFTINGQLIFDYGSLPKTSIALPEKQQVYLLRIQKQNEIIIVKFINR